MQKNQLGLLHVYTGEGKGKTSTAIGLAVRAHGSGLRVAFFQFLKGGESGEIEELKKLGIHVARCAGKTKFVFQMTGDERDACRAQQSALFRQAEETAASSLDLLILDELGGAMSTGMLAREPVLAFLDNRPENLEVAVTGRGFVQEILDRADYVSDIHCLKHPYQQGVPARRGIEF